MGRKKLDNPMFVVINCTECNCEINIRYYDQKRHKRLCRVCAMKKLGESKLDADRDAVFLKKTLRNMKSRCSGVYKHYEAYTKKGISVCDEWVINPDSFVSWAKENKWASGLTIDRIDNSKGYSPENCRWIENSVNVMLAIKEKKSRGASSSVGVWYRKDTGKWASEIKVNKKKISLGCYNSEEEAIIVREKFIEDNGLFMYQRNLMKGGIPQ